MSFVPTPQNIGGGAQGHVPPSQNTNVYHMVVQCSQMFANIKHSITVFNEHLFNVCGDSSKCEKRLSLAGQGHKIGQGC